MTKEAPQVPANIEAEQALLGAVLMNDRTMTFLDMMHPKYFFDPLHLGETSPRQRRCRSNGKRDDRRDQGQVRA